MGDSGGPLVCQRRDGTWVQAGINAYKFVKPGQDNICDFVRDYYELYANVTSLRDWIGKVLRREEVARLRPEQLCDRDAEMMKFVLTIIVIGVAFILCFVAIGCVIRCSRKMFKWTSLEYIFDEDENEEEGDGVKTDDQETASKTDTGKTSPVASEAASEGVAAASTSIVQSKSSIVKSKSSIGSISRDDEFRAGKSKSSIDKPKSSIVKSKADNDTEGASDVGSVAGNDGASVTGSDDTKSTGESAASFSVISLLAAFTRKGK